MLVAEVVIGRKATRYSNVLAHLYGWDCSERSPRSPLLMGMPGLGASIATIPALLVLGASTATGAQPEVASTAGIGFVPREQCEWACAGSFILSGSIHCDHCWDRVRSSDTECHGHVLEVGLFVLEASTTAGAQVFGLSGANVAMACSF